MNYCVRKGVYEVVDNVKRGLLWVGLLVLALLAVACTGGTGKTGNTPGDGNPGGGIEVPSPIVKKTGEIRGKMNGEPFVRYVYMNDTSHFPPEYAMPSYYSGSWQDMNYGVFEVSLKGYVDLDHVDTNVNNVIDLTFNVYEGSTPGSLVKPDSNEMNVFYTKTLLVEEYTNPAGNEHVTSNVEEVYWVDENKGIMAVRGTFSATIYKFDLDSGFDDNNFIEITDGEFDVEIVGRKN